MVRPGRAACFTRWLVSITACVTLGATPLAPAHAVRPAGGAVAIVGLVFEGDVPPAVRVALLARLGQGLAAARHTVMHRAPASGGACSTPACWKDIAARAGCRFVVGGTVKGEERSYELELWMGDGYTGAVVARVRQRCEICGLRAVAEKMDLTASALAAKLEAATRAPARVAVQTDPPGATILVDGDELGPAPREIELPPGPHRLEARAPGFASATRSITGVAGVQERVELRLMPLPRVGTPPARIVGWVALGAGLAAIAGGIALLAIDGRDVDCSEQAPRLCLKRAARAEGATLLGVGVATSGLGGYLLYRTRAQARTGERRATLVPAGAGARLLFSF